MTQDAPAKLIKGTFGGRGAAERQHLVCSVAFGRWPGCPAIAVVALAEGDIQGKVGRPVLLLFHEGAQGVRTLRTLRPLPLEEPLEGAAKHPSLERPHRVILDVRRPPEALEGSRSLLPQRVSNVAPLQIRNPGDGNVDWIDAEGCPRAVRARLAVGQFVGRKDLEQTVTGRADPAGAGGQRLDVPDAPIVSCPEGKEGDGDPRPARTRPRIAR